jgi:hypothetical protein
MDHPYADHHRSDDHWLALCYLHGELTEDEARAWEARLASQEQARQAMIDVLEWSEAIEQVVAQGLAQPANAAATGQRRAPARGYLGRLRAVMVAVAASLLLLASWFWWGRPGELRQDSSKPEHDTSVAFLADAWLDAFQNDIDSVRWSASGAADREARDRAPLPHQRTGAAERDSAAAPVTELAADTADEDLTSPDMAWETPPWLMVAVAGVHGVAYDEADQPQEGRP